MGKVSNEEAGAFFFQDLAAVSGAAAYRINAVYELGGPVGQERVTC